MTTDRFAVEAGHVMTFARAIGDTDPRFQAAMDGGTPFAPPTFVMAAAHYDPDHPLRPRAGEPWYGSGAGPGTAPEGGVGLHAEQHFEYHRPVRAGDVLFPRTEDGRTWTKQGRSGELVFVETVTRYLDAAGEPVVTARTVAVTTRGPTGHEAAGTDA